MQIHKGVPTIETVLMKFNYPSISAVDIVHQVPCAVDLPLAKFNNVAYLSGMLKLQPR